MAPSLVTWPIKKVVKSGFLRQDDDRARGFAHLGDAAGGGRDCRREHRLHGVDDQEAGFDFLHMFENSFQRGFAQDEQIGRVDAEPFGAHFYLPLGFLAGDVETGEPFLADRGDGLEQQRRLADAGIAADEDHRAGHQTAAEDAVELADARLHPALFGGVDVTDGGGIFFAAEAQLAAGRGSFFKMLLGEGVPLIAVGTFAEPLGRLVAATLAGVDGPALAMGVL